MSEKTAISPIRSEDFPEWYQQILKAADLAENSPVRGCMVIKPWGYGIWENIQRSLDESIKETGHENAYFPLFIPVSYLEKEAAHVEGFAKECAVVTHHRLEEKDGKLIPVGELEEPLIVRPTSETIIGETFSKWIKSYRDLPLLINQWANVVRWEMRTRIFLRTTEFLWQEGHTAHATKEEALDETNTMLEVYRKLYEDVLAIPVIGGAKTESERFPGAETTLTLEAMMQDRKALQACTSHYLGQNFSKAANIQFLGEDGNHHFAHTTSWGLSTRSVGGLIMTHGDDNGMRVPPKVAPFHVVILPVIPKDDDRELVLDFCDKLNKELKTCYFDHIKVRTKLDSRDIRGGEKNWQWIKKGIPLRIEIGPKDIDKKSCVLYRRDKEPKEKEFISLDNLKDVIPTFLQEIQDNYYKQAKDLLVKNTVSDISNFSDLKDFFTPKKADSTEIHGGFVRAKLVDDREVEEQLGELKLTVRCIPFDQSDTSGKCVVTGKEETRDVIIAKAY